MRTAYLDREIKPAPEATSGPDGRFFMRVPPWRRNSAVRARDAMFPWVVASAPGFGPGWASAVREPGASGEVDDPAGRGRPADRGPDRRPGGRPVAGARVKAERIWFARDGKLSDWLAQAADGGVQGPWQGLDQLPTAITATTGPDGRFRLTGIGRDRIAELIVSGPTIATAQLYALNRDGTAVATINTRCDDAGTDHLPRPPVRVRRRADQADRGRRPRQGHRPAHRRVDAPRHGLRRAQPRPGAGHRGDDRRPGPLSPHRPAQGARLIGCSSSRATACLTPRRPFGYRPNRPRWNP